MAQMLSPKNYRENEREAKTDGHRDDQTATDGIIQFCCSSANSEVYYFHLQHRSCRLSTRERVKVLQRGDRGERESERFLRYVK